MENFESQSQFTPPQESPIAKKPEREITQEQKEILESAEKFAEHLTSRFPQVDENRRMVIEIDDEGTTVELPELPESMQTEPMMNYYLSGSLATMLLSRAEQFIEIDESQMPGVREGQSRAIPESARQILATFARPIGDLDYVPTDFYSGKKAHVQNSYGKVSSEEYQQMRTKFLWKGGAPKFDEIPEEATKCLKRGETQLSIMVDPVESYGARRVAKITVAGKEYFVARPDSIFAYKVLHLLQGYDQKPEKFNADFGKLLSAMKEMYSEDELLQITFQILTDYESAMEASHRRFYDGDEAKPYEHKIPVFAKRVLGNQSITPEIRGVIERVQKEFEAARQ